MNGRKQNVVYGSCESKNDLLYARVVATAERCAILIIQLTRVCITGVLQRPLLTLTAGTNHLPLLQPQSTGTTLSFVASVPASFHIPLLSYSYYCYSPACAFYLVL